MKAPTQPEELAFAHALLATAREASGDPDALAARELAAKLLLAAHDVDHATLDENGWPEHVAARRAFIRGLVDRARRTNAPAWAALVELVGAVEHVAKRSATGQGEEGDESAAAWILPWLRAMHPVCTRLEPGDIVSAIEASRRPSKAKPKWPAFKRIAKKIGLRCDRELRMEVARLAKRARSVP